MMDDTQQKIDAFQTRFESMIAQIDTARARLDQGIMDDLSALEPQVAQLCAEVQATNPNIARGVQQIMGDLIAKLDEFERDLQAHAQKDNRIQG